MRLYLLYHGRIFGIDSGLGATRRLDALAKELGLPEWIVVKGHEDAISHLYNWTQTEIEEGNLDRLRRRIETVQPKPATVRKFLTHRGETVSIQKVDSGLPWEVEDPWGSLYHFKTEQKAEAWIRKNFPGSSRTWARKMRISGCE